MCRLSWNLRSSNLWNPQGLSRPVMGLLYLLLYTLVPRQYRLCMEGVVRITRESGSLWRKTRVTGLLASACYCIYSFSGSIDLYTHIFQRLQPCMYNVQDGSVYIHGLCQSRPCAADRVLSYIGLCDKASVRTRNVVRWPPLSLSFSHRLSNFERCRSQTLPSGS
jgi:hypothetical protein